MSSDFVRSLLAAAAVAVIGMIVGFALCWTVLQALVLACSLGLFLYWLLRLRVGMDEGVLGSRNVGLVIVAALFLFARAAFFTDLSEYLRMGQPAGSHGLLHNVEVPRFLSMGLALLPAAPYAAYVVIALIPSREA